MPAAAATTPAGSVERQLLSAKLTAPAALPRQVVRQAMVDAACTASGVKLVLLRAPAGFGKSTVMLQCRDRLQAAGVTTGWLTVDRADNDASRFLAGLEAAGARLTRGHQKAPEAPAASPTPRGVAPRADRRVPHPPRPH